MRRHTPAPLALLAALAVSAPWTARRAAAQEHEHHAGTSGPPAGLSRVVDRGDELLFEYGPVSLPARATHDDVRQPPTLLFALPTDGWMRGYAVDLVDARGRVLPLPLGLTLTPWRARFLHPQGWVCRA